MQYHDYLETPCGTLAVYADEDGITAVKFDDVTVQSACPSALTREACSQLNAYFSGQLQQFSLPLSATGTAFQKQVWAALATIPFGQTVSYSVIAHQLDNPKAVRAVGMANSKNPIAIIVPCHRVIGANGTLTGYAGGLHRKAYLLELEGAKQ